MTSPLPPVVATFLANITDVKTKMADYESTVGKTAAATEADMAATEAAVDRQVAEMGAAAAAAGEDFDATAAKAELMATKTEEASATSSGAFTKMAAVGKVALLGIGVAAVAIGVKSLSAAMDYQTLTTQLVTGAGESEGAIGKVSAGLLKMAPAVGIGPDALAKSMFTVESAGYHAGAGLQVMQAAAEGAKIGGADATVVANGLTTAMTDYQIPAAQAAATTSKLIETVASGKTTMGDLSGSLSNVLPAAAAAKVGINQVLGAMATMTGEGISADQASQDLAGTIRSLQNPTQQQTQAMQALGLNSLTVAQNLGTKGLTGTLGDLVTAITSKMGPAGTVLEDTFKKSQTAAADAQTELKAMPASMQKIATSFMNGKLTSAQWRAAMKGMTTDQKQMAQQFATTVQSGKGFNDLLKTGGPSAETFSAALSKVTGGSTGMNTALALTGGNMATFQNNVKNIGAASTEAGGHVQGWSETTKDLSFKLEQAKAWLDALWIQIGQKLIPVVDSAISIGIKWGNWLGQHKLVLEAVGAIIGVVLVAAIGAYIASLVAAAAAQLVALAPIIAIVAACALLAAGIYELYTHWSSIWGEIKSITADVGNFIVGVFNKVVDFLKQWGPLILSVLLPFIGLPLLVMQHWGAITGFFSDLWGDVEGVFGTAISWVVNFFSALPGRILSVLSSAGSWLVSKGTDIVQGLYNGVLNGAKTLFSFWLTLNETIVRDIGNGALWLVSIGENVINGLINGIENSMGKLESTVKGIGGKAVGWAKDALSIFSPSQVMADEVGKYIPLGIAQGIDQNMNAVKTSTQSVGAAAVNGVAAAGRAPVQPASAPAANGQTTIYQFQVDGSIIDYNNLWNAMQTAALQHGAVNSGTYVPFAR